MWISTVIYRVLIDACQLLVVVHILIITSHSVVLLVIIVIFLTPGWVYRIDGLICFSLGLYVIICPPYKPLEKNKKIF